MIIYLFYFCNSLPKVINLFFDFGQQIHTNKSYKIKREEIVYIMNQNESMNNGFQLKGCSDLKIFNCDLVS